MTDPWEVSRLRAWIRAIGPKVSGLGPFELLEISPTDDATAVRDAYHAVAATRHPDLFRGKLTEAEAEALMHLFARVTGAYAKLRDPAERARYAPKRSGKMPAQTPPGGTKLDAPAPSAASSSSGLRKIAPRALSHARRAEALLGRGDVASAILHLRMAVAADPGARELRDLLADTEAKLKK